MALRCKCPRCGQGIQVPDNLAGRRARCPACQTVLKFPGTDASAPPSPDRGPSSQPQWVAPEGRLDADLSLDDLPATPQQRHELAPDILFQSAYGGVPKFVLLGAVPFLMFATGAVFSRAVWFNAGIDFRGIELSPAAVIYGVCPVLVVLCALLPGAEIYHRLRPHRVLLTTRGVTVPKRRFSAQEVHIPWSDLKATRVVYTGFYDMYEVRCVDRRNGTKATVYSAMFRHFDDFATFALIVGERVGQDWSIKGFLPGTFRGNRQQRS